MFGLSSITRGTKPGLVPGGAIQSIYCGFKYFPGTVLLSNLQWMSSPVSSKLVPLTVTAVLPWRGPSLGSKS